MKYFVTAVIVLLASTTSAKVGFWKDEVGRAIPETEARKSKNDFAGWLLVTPDEDWQAKWNTPSHTVPTFKEAKDVSRGKKLFVLIFFSNPKLDAAGIADVRCDLRVTRPDRSVSIDQKEATCFKGPIMGSPYNLYLSAPAIVFVGEPADPTGAWSVDVVLRDNTRHTELSLRTSFTLH
jgi:hypothetical protein